METEKFLHMNKGEGEASYAKNSDFQRYVISILITPVLTEALTDTFDRNIAQSSSIGIADLGCSSGPNSLMAISFIVKKIHAICCEYGIGIPELKVALNDLPNNDFNNVFSSLPEFYDELRRTTGQGHESCFVSGVAGSFYGRLFPRKSLHLVHSSMSVHWLSKVPEGLQDLNVGTLFASERSPDYAVKAYQSQFETDFYTFLQSRSEEIVSGGRMVLCLLGRNSPTKLDIYQHEVMDLAFLSMASEGLVEHKKIDSFNVPLYPPAIEEAKKVIEKEASFTANEVQTFEVEWEAILREETSKAKAFSNALRAAYGPMFEAHFGSRVTDEMFKRLTKLADASVLESSCVLVASLTRRSHS